MYVCMIMMIICINNLGEFKNDQRCGNGTELYANGDSYRYNRMFTTPWPSSSSLLPSSSSLLPLSPLYRGTFYNDQRHGMGRMIHLNTTEYHGQWIYGMKQGEGVFTFKNNDVYSGMWYRDRKNGMYMITYV